MMVQFVTIHFDSGQVFREWMHEREAASRIALERKLRDRGSSVIHGIDRRSQYLPT